MNGEFTRKELYDLVWSQPMTTVAVGVTAVLVKESDAGHSMTFILPIFD